MDSKNLVIKKRGSLKKNNVSKKETLNSIARAKKEAEILRKLEEIKRRNAKKRPLLKDMEKEDDLKKAKGKRRKRALKKKHVGGFKIKTDFDTVLAKVNKWGLVDATRLRLQLGMGKQQFGDCIEILENQRLIKTDYPVVGKLHLLSMDYEKRKKEEEKKEKEQKQKLKELKKEVKEIKKKPEKNKKKKTSKRKKNKKKKSKRKKGAK